MVSLQNRQTKQVIRFPDAIMEDSTTLLSVESLTAAPLSFKEVAVDLPLQRYTLQKNWEIVQIQCEFQETCIWREVRGEECIHWYRLDETVTGCRKVESVAPGFPSRTVTKFKKGAKVALTWKELLTGLVKASERVIRVAECARKFHRPSGEMGARLKTLRQWNYLRYADKSKKGYGGYVITPWGKKTAQRLEKERENE